MYICVYIYIYKELPPVTVLIRFFVFVVIYCSSLFFASSCLFALSFVGTPSGRL